MENAQKQAAGMKKSQYNPQRKISMMEYQKTLKTLTIRIKYDEYDVIESYAMKSNIAVRKLLLLAVSEYIINHPIE